ncbi:MAG: DUF2927 domain-containing protein [Paracoccaceae bacterium]
MRPLLIALLVLGGACMPAPEPPEQAVPVVRQVAPAVAAKPAFPGLGSALPAGHTAYDNASLARLFVVLTHEMEGRARRPHLVRYEVPVSVGIEGPGSERYGAFLDGFLGQIRRNSGIAITRGPGPENLHVRFIDGKRFDATLPAAVCVIATGDLSWEAFAADPLRSSAREAAKARRIEQMTIFIPDNTRPYRVRNCLLEEVPQALGMSNDLFGLGTSSFNDDGAHLWPTKLDYLMLRVLYAPEMATGLDRRETRDRALRVLNRINPAGRAAPPLPMLRRRSLDVWSHLIGRVFSRDASDREVREDVGKALQIVEAQAPMSAQHCHTLVTAGRVLSRPEPERALQLLDLAGRVCDAAHGVSDIRHARIRLEEACALLRLSRFGEAIAVTESIWPVLAAHGQDRPLAALYTIQSEALEAVEPGSPRALTAGRLATAWNGYAMGPGRPAASCRPKV